MQIAIVLGLLLVAVVLFAMETLSVDIIALSLLIVLAVTGIQTVPETFAGFSNEMIVILASAFVISGALQRTGIVEAFGDILYKVTANNPAYLTLAVMVAAGALSAFMNNTTTVAVLMPPVIGLSRKARISPSKLLMPLAFGSILGGTCTLIGTSTNVAVSGFLARSGMRPLSFFEFADVGLTLLVVGVAYMVILGQRLLPAHKGESRTEDYAIREYLSEIVVAPTSPLLGQKIFESELSKQGFRILEILRGQDKIIPDSMATVRAGDILLVEGKIGDLMKVTDLVGIEIKAGAQLEDADLQSADIKIVEALIMPQSGLVDRTLKEVNFRQRHGATALAIYRHGHSLREKLGRIRLHMGDVLLIQGQAERLRSLRRAPDLCILEELDASLFRRAKPGYVAVLVFAAAIITGVIGWLPLAISFLTAAVLVMLLHCITVEEAYRFIDWRMIILVGGMTAFGTAMEKTGTARFLAELIVQSLGRFGEMGILAGLFGLTVVLTQPMSNAAAALVVLPVALSTAQKLGSNERTYAIAVMLAGSLSLITPFEPACMLVYGPGMYGFRDFVKTGLLLTIILSAIALFMIPLQWPLHPGPAR